MIVDYRRQNVTPSCVMVTGVPDIINGAIVTDANRERAGGYGAIGAIGAIGAAAGRCR